MNDVALCLTGEGLDGVELTDGSFNVLRSGTLFGTGEPAQYLQGGSFDDDGEWTGEFYIRIPADRDDIKDLAVHAMAGASNVPVVGGTPLVFVFDKNGVHSWDAIQGFIGGGNEGALADVFAEATFHGEDLRGDIYVSKEVVGNTDENFGQEFTFRILHSRTQDFEPSAAVNLRNYRVQGARSIDYANNTFTLRHGGLAMVRGLPTTFYYDVIEIVPDAIADDYNVSYSISGVFQIDESSAAGYSTVRVTNTYTVPSQPPERPERPQTPEEPGQPEEPEEPGQPHRPDRPTTPPKGPDRPDMPPDIGNYPPPLGGGDEPEEPEEPEAPEDPNVPQTNVNSPAVNAAMMLMAIGMMAIAVLYRKEERNI